MSIMGVPDGSVVKNLPAVQETQGAQEDPLEEEMATHSSVFLPEKLYGQRILTGYSPKGCKELDTTEHPVILSEHYINVNVILTSTVAEMDSKVLMSVNDYVFMNHRWV